MQRRINVNKVDLFFPFLLLSLKHREVDMQDGANTSGKSGDTLLFLTDEQLRNGIEAMFFAYRGFTADPDRILEEFRYGRAHHRAIHFINRHPGTTVSNLITILGVTKQSLNRVLRKLVENGLVEVTVGAEDRRTRRLHLTQEGRELEHRLSEAQRKRMRAAYRAAGPEAVAGFRAVLDQITDPRFRSKTMRDEGRDG